MCDWICSGEKRRVAAEYCGEVREWAVVRLRFESWGAWLSERGTHSQKDLVFCAKLHRFSKNASCFQAQLWYNIRERNDSRGCVADI